jgi:hypothetical protein
VQKARLTPVLLTIALVAPSTAIGQQSPRYTSLEISPAKTDARIDAADPPHVVMYDPATKPGNVLLFLPGTGGKPPGPVMFLRTAVARGYRVISLAYDDTPAVAQVCRGAKLRQYPDCAELFRQERIYGDASDAPIRTAPQDTILNRLVKLLEYLASTDPQGGWNQYVQNGSPVWNRIALSGQSQGGGMAEFIAQRVAVARVIIFSGGWDRYSAQEIARWYFAKPATPADRWFATYNKAEPMASVIPQTYTALGIPASQTFALDKPLADGDSAHADGVDNPAYRDLWITMLGNGSP